MPDSRLNLNLITPGGIPYAMQFDGYGETFARDNNQIFAILRCEWSRAGEFRNEMVGYTTWELGKPYLNRHLPFQCPLEGTLYCDSLELVGKGCFPERENIFNPDLDGWLDLDWVSYRAIFRRPPYVIEDDAVGYTGQQKKEYQRYTSGRFRPRPREKRINALQLMMDDNTPINQSAFLPDNTILIHQTWYQVPVAAVPWYAITMALGKVNLFDIELSRGVGTTPLLCRAESLLFHGPNNEEQPYAGADGDLYYDLDYVFEYYPTISLPESQNGTLGNPYGWNGYQKFDGTWHRVVWQSNPALSPYQMFDHTGLFVPGN